MKSRRKPDAAELSAAVAADIPIPVETFYTTVGNRTMFFRWQREGLEVVIWNRRRCVRPSTLREFVNSRATKVNSERQP